MGARIRTELTKEEERTLRELGEASGVPRRVKERAQVIRLSNQGMYNDKIAKYIGRSIRTVRVTINRWRKKGLGGLWDAAHPGAQRRWKEEDMEYVEECLRKEQRTYNSHQLAQKLEKERNIKLSAGHLREVLKKRG